MAQYSTPGTMLQLAQTHTSETAWSLQASISGWSLFHYMQFRFNVREVEMGTRRPLIVQMYHDPTAQEPRCRLQVWGHLLGAAGQVSGKQSGTLDISMCDDG
jgi:hypothetical protein